MEGRFRGHEFGIWTFLVSTTRPTHFLVFFAARRAAIVLRLCFECFQFHLRAVYLDLSSKDTYSGPAPVDIQTTG